MRLSRPSHRLFVLVYMLAQAGNLIPFIAIPQQTFDRLTINLIRTISFYLCISLHIKPKIGGKSEFCAHIDGDQSIRLTVNIELYRSCYSPLFLRRSPLIYKYRKLCCHNDLCIQVKYSNYLYYLSLYNNLRFSGLDMQQAVLLSSFPYPRPNPLD